MDQPLNTSIGIELQKHNQQYNGNKNYRSQHLEVPVHTTKVKINRQEWILRRRVFQKLNKKEKYPYRIRYGEKSKQQDSGYGVFFINK